MAQLQECIDVHGCEVITEVDIEAWQAAMQPVYDQYGAAYADIIAQIEAIEY